MQRRSRLHLAELKLFNPQLVDLHLSRRADLPNQFARARLRRSRLRHAAQQRRQQPLEPVRARPGAHPAVQLRCIQAIGVEPKFPAAHILLGRERPIFLKFAVPRCPEHVRRREMHPPLAVLPSKLRVVQLKRQVEPGNLNLASRKIDVSIQEFSVLRAPPGPAQGAFRLALQLPAALERPAQRRRQRQHVFRVLGAPIQRKIARPRGHIVRGGDDERIPIFWRGVLAPARRQRTRTAA